MITGTKQNTKKLNDMMRAAILAVGQAASTETGRMLFAMAYENDRDLDWTRDSLLKYEGKRPSKGSQEAKYYEGLALGKRNAFASALASMASEMSGGTASMQRCRYVINEEIDIMRGRTEAEQDAAPITALCSKVIDW